MKSKTDSAVVEVVDGLGEGGWLVRREWVGGDEGK